jgi:hypothetical protein
MAHDSREFRHLLSRKATLSEDDVAFGAKFLEDIAGEDAVGVVVRAHLYVESTLTQLIEKSLARPQAIDAVRLPFALKVRLAIALGAVPEDFRAPLQELNTLRNKLVHRLDAKVDATDEDRLFNSLTEFERDLIEGKELRGTLAYIHGRLHGLLNRVRFENSPG